MSQYFDLNEKTLWNPSNGASRIFQRQIAAFEAELELPSGIGPMENDESQINVEIFEPFVNALLTKHRRTSHAIWLAVAEGFTETVLVLAERAGIKVDWTSHGAASEAPLTEGSLEATGDAWATPLRERAEKLERSMPH